MNEVKALPQSILQLRTGHRPENFLFSVAQNLRGDGSRISQCVSAAGKLVLLHRIDRGSIHL